MLLSPYHAGGQRPPAQVLRNSLPGHSRLAAISASWLVFSKVAPPVTRVPSKGSLALILPTSWAPSHKATDGHAFRSAHVPRALCSTDISCKQNGVKKWHFFTPFISFYSVGVKNGTFLHQIRDSANAPPCYNPCYASGGRRNSRRELRSTGADESDLLTQSCQLSYVATGRSISTWRKRREAELRTRLAEHRSG